MVAEATGQAVTRSIDVECRVCHKHIIGAAGLGARWEAIKHYEPQVKPVREFDPNEERDHDPMSIRLHGLGDEFLESGICTGTVGGLWARFGVTEAIPGLWKDRITQPFRAGVNGDAADWCIVGQPTIIEHRCRIAPGSGKVSTTATRTIRLESIAALGHQIERAIRDGRRTISL